MTSSYDSSFCRTALLGFAIRINTLVNMKEGDNQRDQGEGLPPLSLSLRFSPSWLPLSLSIPLPRWGVGGTRKTVWTLYILSIQGRLTLHVRRLVHISQVSSVFLKGQCQCSCTDKVTEILMPCRYGKCFKWRWRYISLYSFNNNGFFGRHTRTPPTYHRGSSCLLIEGMYINFRCT